MINSTTQTTNKNNTQAFNPQSILKKDDFLKLLLTELQYQDPTSPMDSEKILSQTSQLATLESANNTNKTMEALMNQLKSTSDFNAVSSIGKMGSLGTDKILLSKDASTNFEIYFKHDIKNGQVDIKDSNGNIVKTFNLQPQKGGVLSFEWDGTDNGGQKMPEGSYSVSANYSDGSTGSYNTAYGVYPIESVRFDEGKALLKLGSNYYPISQVKEIYQ
jgi:flagellar basal-body rod modification protein FlgD